MAGHTEEKKEKIKKFGEVFTPPELVNEMLDKLPKDLWLDKTKTWLDPACGNGNFLVEVKRRLMESLVDEIPDAQERERHILENQIHGVEIQRCLVDECVERLGAAGYHHHIVCADALKYDYSFDGSYKVDEEYEQGSLFDMK